MSAVVPGLPCAVHDCNEEADGVLLHQGVVLAAICNPHALALQTDVHEMNNGELYRLNPARAKGWRLYMHLGQPYPAIYPPGELVPQ